MNEIKIFADGKQIGMAKDVTIHIAPSYEDSEPSGWPQGKHEWSGTVTLTPENDEPFRKFIESMKFSRKERRKMFHAVTHGGAVAIHTKSEELPEYIFINRPSVLRRLLAGNKGFRFDCGIVDHFESKDKVILSEFGR